MSEDRSHYATAHWSMSTHNISYKCQGHIKETQHNFSICCIELLSLFTNQHKPQVIRQQTWSASSLNVCSGRFVTCIRWLWPTLHTIEHILRILFTLRKHWRWLCEVKATSHCKINAYKHDKFIQHRWEFPYETEVLWKRVPALNNCEIYCAV